MTEQQPETVQNIEANDAKQQPQEAPKEEPQLEEADFPEDFLNQLNSAEELSAKYGEMKENGSILKQEYLEKSVLPLVLEGLSWIIKEHPNDPVEHLAMFLLKNNKKEEQPAGTRPVTEQPSRVPTAK